MPTKKEKLIEEAKRWGINVKGLTAAQLQAAIDDAKAEARADVAATTEAEPAESAPAAGAGRYKAVCNIAFGPERVINPGEEVELSASEAESLLKQGAIERV